MFAKSLEQVAGSLSLLLRQFSSNVQATKQAFGCKPSGVFSEITPTLTIYVSGFHWEQSHKCHYLSNFEVLFPLQLEIYYTEFQVFCQSLLNLVE